MFQRATKKKAKLRITLDGPAGSGKTYSSLVLAKALGGKTALIDSEHASASKYASLFEFDSAELAEFSLETYIKAILAAGAAKYDNLIIDSLSHAWTGKGGALEQVDRMGGNQGKGFTSGWRHVTPLHTRLIDTMLSFPGHLIVTMRTKMEYVLETDSKGKQVPRKVGMAPVQREGMEYEFDVVADLDLGGGVTIAKTRCPDLSGSAGLLRHGDVPELGAKLKAWLSDGADVPTPAPTPPQPTTEDLWSTAPPKPSNGAPSEMDLCRDALEAAQSRKDLDAIVPRIKKLPPLEQHALRGLFGRRLTEVSSNAQH